MAVLTDEQKAKIGGDAVKDMGVSNVTRADLYAAVQAIENDWEGHRAALGAAIDAATVVNFTNSQKKLIGKHWMRTKFSLGG